MVRRAPGSRRRSHAASRAPRDAIAGHRNRAETHCRGRQLPLYRVLDRIADPALDEKYRDTLCVAVLPYLHSRMPATMVIKPLRLMSDEELEQMRQAELELCARSSLSAA